MNFTTTSLITRIDFQICISCLVLNFFKTHIKKESHSLYDSSISTTLSRNNG